MGRHRKIFHLQAYSPNGCRGQCWGKPKPGVRSFLHVSYTTTWAIFHCPFQAISSELSQNRNSWDTNWCSNRLLALQVVALLAVSHYWPFLISSFCGCVMRVFLSNEKYLLSFRIADLSHINKWHPICNLKCEF